MFNLMCSPYLDGDPAGGDPGGPGAPNSEPGSPDPAATPGGPAAEPTSVPSEQFKAMQARATRAEQQNSGGMKVLMDQMNKLVHGMKPATPATPAATPGLQVPDGLKTALGEDVATQLAAFLQQTLQQGGQANKGEMSRISNAVDEQQFFAQYPQMAPMRPMMTSLTQAFESGELPIMSMVALATRGMMAQQISESAVAAALKTGESEWKKKHLASAGPGGGIIDPVAQKTAQEAQKKEAEATFGVKNPKYTNRPADN